ncbi:hypothetical protein [uncultured Aquimarina sp.]|uniref:hypothetical protein n=1 Tax=uncultured Aquimarina sp. TaxID=575652 RepID=UPI0026164674|nr:hypothetical protein [uncultured Aquimarina sp.]
MNIFSQITKWYKDRIELKKSDLGRNYGWFIEFEDKVVGELSNYSKDAFYDVVSYEGYEDVVFNEDIWMSVGFKLRNKIYDQYSEGWYTGFYPGDLIKVKKLRFRYLWTEKL